MFLVLVFGRFESLGEFAVLGEFRLSELLLAMLVLHNLLGAVLIEFSFGIQIARNRCVQKTTQFFIAIPDFLRDFGGKSCTDILIQRIESFFVHVLETLELCFERHIVVHDARNHIFVDFDVFAGLERRRERHFAFVQHECLDVSDGGIRRRDGVVAAYQNLVVVQDFIYDQTLAFSRNRGLDGILAVVDF